MTQPRSSCHGYKQHLHYNTQAWPARILPACLRASDPPPTPCQEINLCCRYFRRFFRARAFSLDALISSELWVLRGYTANGFWDLNLFQSHRPPGPSWKVTVGLHRCSGPDLSLNVLPNNIHLLWGVYIYQITLRLSDSGHGSWKAL